MTASPSRRGRRALARPQTGALPVRALGLRLENAFPGAAARAFCCASSSERPADGLRRSSGFGELAGDAAILVERGAQVFQRPPSAEQLQPHALMEFHTGENLDKADFAGPCHVCPQQAQISARPNVTIRTSPVSSFCCGTGWCSSSCIGGECNFAGISRQIAALASLLDRASLLPEPDAGKSMVTSPHPCGSPRCHSRSAGGRCRRECARQCCCMRSSRSQSSAP